jgi:Golgi nucleoside diphosphatase
LTFILGGISSFAANPSQAGESLKDCLLKAEEVIPPSKHSSSPIYLGATAGMRLLEYELALLLYLFNYLSVFEIPVLWIIMLLRPS